jgi:hypothetical protein
MNPGISAAGSAAGRTALDPSTGPAAIGGMLSLKGAGIDELPEGTPLEARLSMVVTDITRLANAMEVLSSAFTENASGAGHARRETHARPT